MDFFATSDDILRLSLLTLVLRAAPPAVGAPTTFVASCTEAARATLHRHQDCLAIIGRSSEDLLPTYLHWYVTPGRLVSVLCFGMLTAQDPALRPFHSFHRGILSRG